MALGAVLLRKRYSRYDQVAAVLLCSGLVGFTLSDRHGGSDGGGGGRASSPLGVGVLLFAVSCDAVQVLLSERMLRSSPLLTPNHVMMHTNGFAFVAVVAGMIVTGEAAVAPWASLPWFRLCIYGACSWVGVCCFIALTRSWGATAAVRAIRQLETRSALICRMHLTCRCARAPAGGGHECSQAPHCRPLLHSLPQSLLSELRALRPRGRRGGGRALVLAARGQGGNYQCCQEGGLAGAPTRRHRYWQSRRQLATDRVSALGVLHLRYTPTNTVSSSPALVCVCPAACECRRVCRPRGAVTVLSKVDQGYGSTVWEGVPGGSRHESALCVGEYGDV